MKRSVILTVFSLLVLAHLGQAQMPQTISYQGVLRDAGTKEIVANGNYDLTFKIWDAATGGTTLWTEMHLNATTNAVPIADGIFSVILGQITALPDPFPSPTWLEIVDGTGTPLDPRIELTAAPYSLNARVVTGVDNFFPGTGRVGIGTPNPQAELHVARGDWILGSSSALPGLGESAWLTSGAGILYDAGGADWAHHFSAYGGGDIARFGISTGVGVAPDTRVVITNSGNVGIGTTNPSKTLTVNSGSSTITGWFMGPEGGTELYVGSAEASGALVVIRSDASNNRGNIRLWGDTEANGISIISGGNVGIGIATPAFKLEVAGDASILGDLNVQGTITQGSQTKYYSFGARDVNALLGDQNYLKAYVMAGAPAMEYPIDTTIPIHLPQGATITDITIHVDDNDETYDATGSLYALVGTSFTQLESSLTPITAVSSSGSGTQSPKTTLTTPYTIDNQTNIYWLRIHAGTGSVDGPTILFYGGYITYNVN